MRPEGTLPIAVFNRYLLAGLCFALAVGVAIVVVNEWLLAREVAR